MVDEIPRRNAESVMQTLMDMETLLRQMRVELNTFSGLVANIDQRLALLEQVHVQQRIKAMGPGPTVQ